MHYAKYDAVAHHEEDAPKETEKVFVISFSYACSYPWAVVIQALDTASTESAMDRPWWSVNVTILTVFHSCYSSIQNIHVLLHSLFLRRVVYTSLIGFDKVSLQEKNWFGKCFKVYLLCWEWSLGLSSQWPREECFQKFEWLLLRKWQAHSRQTLIEDPMEKQF